MAFLTIALTVLAVASPVVVYVRVKSGGERPGPVLGFVATVGAFAFGGGATLTAVVAPFVLPIIPDPIFASDTWVSRLLAGSAVGAILFLAMRVLFYDLSLAVLDWSLRRPSVNQDSIAEKLRWIAGGTIGFAVIFAFMFLVVDAFGSRSELWLIPLLVLFATAFPLYETMLLPWLKHHRHASSPSKQTQGVQQWLDEVCKGRDIPRFQVRIQEGDLANAFAVGGFVRHLIVIGGGLVKGMTEGQVKAVLAHELAHVIRRDVPKRILPMVIVAGTCYVLFFYYYVGPLYREETVPSVLTGTLFVMLATWVLYVLIPGFFMRRMELQTDRLAVELLEDGELLAEALLRLAELNDHDIRRTSWSHPSTRDRVKAIRRLARGTA
ncbi:MAG: M48 family metalloprotease [Gammaproteobacteria bacterium]|nr:M48 family metalloprotease [Gammaproteobacteria bacterium]